MHVHVAPLHTWDCLKCTCIGPCKDPAWHECDHHSRLFKFARHSQCSLCKSNSGHTVFNSARAATATAAVGPASSHSPLTLFGTRVAACQITVCLLAEVAW